MISTLKRLSETEANMRVDMNTDLCKYSRSRIFIFIFLRARAVGGVGGGAWGGGGEADTTSCRI